jgi:hypothetical protein
MEGRNIGLSLAQSEQLVWVETHFLKMFVRSDQKTSWIPILIKNLAV